MKQLHEQYRPDSLSDVAGQADVVKALSVLARRGLGGRAYWLAGPSGTGKTTVARIIAGEGASEWGVEELDCSGLMPGAIKDWERRASRLNLGDPSGWALILNEAHGLRKDTIRQLLVTLERLPPYVVVCFTTTGEGRDKLFEDCIDAHPLLSRCIELPFQASGDQLELDFAMQCMLVSRAEAWDGQPVTAYVNLVRKHKSNLRACLQEVEAGGMMLDERSH